MADILNHRPAPERELPEGFRTELRVFTGLSEDWTDGKARFGWRTVSPDGTLEETTRGTLKNAGHSNTPGGVYEWVVNDAGEFYSTGKLAPWYVGSWGDKDEVRAWTVASNLVTLRKAQKDRARKEGDVNEIKACLKPIAQAMKRTNHQGRTLIIAQVIQYLQSPSLLE